MAGQQQKGFLQQPAKRWRVVFGLDVVQIRIRWFLVPRNKPLGTHDRIRQKRSPLSSQLLQNRLRILAHAWGAPRLEHAHVRRQFNVHELQKHALVKRTGFLNPQKHEHEIGLGRGLLGRKRQIQNRRHIQLFDLKIRHPQPQFAGQRTQEVRGQRRRGNERKPNTITYI